MLIPSLRPIVVMPMNGVSDIDLALVVNDAGAFPSISIFNYYKDKNIDFHFLDKELKRYNDIAGHSNLLMSITWESLFDNNMFDLVIKNDIKYLELFVRPSNHVSWPLLATKVSEMRKGGIKFFFKTTKILPESEYDAIILKGPKGAGRSFEYTDELTSTFRELSNIIGANKIIPSGGIGNNNEVRTFLKNGAPAVGIGSLIAASLESKISNETKLKILQSTSKDIQKIGPLNCRGLLFSIIENDDDNNTKGLRAGIKGTDSGCIYVGDGIDYINEILPVKDIINRLSNVN